MTITPTAPTTPTAAPRRPSWSGGRTALVVAGSLLALLGAGTLAAGGVAVWAGQQRDSDGYLTSDPGSFATDSYAITSPSLHLDMTGPDLYGEGQLGALRVQVQPAEPGASLFVGIGPADDVAGYLDPVNHVEVSDLDAGPFDVTYTAHAGGQPATDPAAQTFWAASDAGTGPLTVTLPITSGDWAVVVMNADSSAGVRADVTAGAKLPILGTVAVIAFVAGGVLLAGGIAMIVVPVVTRGRSGW